MPYNYNSDPTINTYLNNLGDFEEYSPTDTYGATAKKVKANLLRRFKMQYREEQLREHLEIELSNDFTETLIIKYKGFKIQTSIDVRQGRVPAGALVGTCPDAPKTIKILGPATWNGVTLPSRFKTKYWIHKDSYNFIVPPSNRQFSSRHQTGYRELYGAIEQTAREYENLYPSGQTIAERERLANLAREREVRAAQEAAARLEAARIERERLENARRMEESEINNYLNTLKKPARAKNRISLEEIASSIPGVMELNEETLKLKHGKFNLELLTTDEGIAINRFVMPHFQTVQETLSFIQNLGSLFS